MHSCLRCLDGTFNFVMSVANNIHHNFKKPHEGYCHPLQKKNIFFATFFRLKRLSY